MIKRKEKPNQYKNPDKRCCYPYDDSGVGYCWFYAEMVDDKASVSEIEKGCDGCEYWEPNKCE